MDSGKRFTNRSPESRIGPGSPPRHHQERFMNESWRFIVVISLLVAVGVLLPLAAGAHAVLPFIG
jgi:hypothetical protein